MADFRHSGLQLRRISATRRNFSAPLRLRAEIFRPPCSAPPRKKFEKFTSLLGTDRSSKNTAQAPLSITTCSPV
ncbi:unnamed protein product [Oikopleura dioica]|uniref:Uncharacterized protein n=1 Tax=Oikopleura dioica TaxID=34765 RepID=E4XB59_OIKDI|nr:unnamed protein product [Oikopleura dioica]